MNLPTCIFGLHDAGGEGMFREARKTGWFVISVALNESNPNASFSALSAAGHAVVVRLNNGYDTAGTLPPSSQYDSFAQACANFVARSAGANIWIIGNETNLASERPALAGGERQVITPDLVALCFAKCRAAIRNLPGHGGDWVIPAAPGPWNTETQYPANPDGDWVTYFQDILTHCIQLGQPPDALALHTYTHGADPNLVSAPSPMNFGRPRCYDFRAYRDFLGVVPAQLRSLPVLITEAQPIPWQDGATGWIKAAYSEIDSWNADPAHQPVQALCLFRWANSGQAGWVVSTRDEQLDELRQVLEQSYPVRWAAPVVPAQPPRVPPQPPRVPDTRVPPQPPKVPDGPGWYPAAVKRPITSANYTVGRDGHSIQAVVLHVAAGFLRGTFPTFNNPAGQTSAHFCIGKDGAVEQYVSIFDTAYGNGLRWTGTRWLTPTVQPVTPLWPGLLPGINPNSYTVSIEHEGYPEDPWTAPMYDANNYLLQWIAARTGLHYVPHYTLAGHDEIDPVDRPNCPGPNVDYERICLDANGGIDAVALAVSTEAQARSWLAINTDGALYKYAQRSSLGWPLTAEFRYTLGADDFVGQVFETAVAYVKVGDYANIHPVVPQPSDAGARSGSVGSGEGSASPHHVPLPGDHGGGTHHPRGPKAPDSRAATPGARDVLPAGAAPDAPAGVSSSPLGSGGSPASPVGPKGPDSPAGAAPPRPNGVQDAGGVPTVSAALAAAAPLERLVFQHDSGLCRFARDTKLGCPQTAEFSVLVDNRDYQCQVFKNAIAYCASGDAGHIRFIPKVFVAAINAARRQSWLPINTGSALYKAAQQGGMGCPQTGEFEFNVGASPYVLQAYANGIAYVLKGDFGNVRTAHKSAGNAPIIDTVLKAVFAAAAPLPLLSINVDAGLYRYGQQAALGCPHTSEFDFDCEAVTYTGQLFNLGMVYQVKGNQRSTRWLAKPAR